MKSVGEVMAIGRTFEEAFQKGTFKIRCKRRWISLLTRSQIVFHIPNAVLKRTLLIKFSKAIRQVDPKYVGFQGDKFDDLDEVLRNPTDRRWLAVGQAMLHENYSVDRVHELTKIDKVIAFRAARTKLTK